MRLLSCRQGQLFFHFFLRGGGCQPVPSGNWLDERVRHRVGVGRQLLEAPSSPIPPGYEPGGTGKLPVITPFTVQKPVRGKICEARCRAAGWSLSPLPRNPGPPPKKKGDCRE